MLTGRKLQFLGDKNMVLLSRICTKTGDDGKTSLGDGERISKNASRLHACGTVDELNANVGIAVVKSSGQMNDGLALIQNNLFDVGSDLCRPGISDTDDRTGQPILRILPSQVEYLESEIEDMSAQLSPLRSFVLPGGNEFAAYLHICRVIARRAERLIVDLLEHEPEGVNTQILLYLNRLSDWFFLAARVANDSGRSDILWIPGKGREYDN
jgi:cob(I)alamin adenosyltransferase